LQSLETSIDSEWNCDEYGCDGYSWDEMATWISELYTKWGWDNTVECDASGCTENLEGWGENWYDWEYFLELYEENREFDFANYGITCDEYGCDGYSWEEMAS
jgi:hypothetical protein